MLQPIGSAAVTSLPDFLALDLVAGSLSASVFSDEKAESTDTAPLSCLNLYNNKLNKAKEAASNVSWLKVIGYQSTLLRLCSMSTLNVIDDDTPTNNVADLLTCVGLDNPSLQQSDIVKCQNIVQSLPFSGPWVLRLSYIHKFLSQNSPLYGVTCRAVEPPSLLELTPVSDDTNSASKLLARSYTANHLINGDGTTFEVPLESTRCVLAKVDDTMLVQPKDGLLCISWYHPILDRLVQPDTNSDQQIIMFYSLFSKPNNKSCGIRLVSTSLLHKLHNRLSSLVQMCELLTPIETGDAKKKKKTKKTSTGSLAAGEQVSDDQCMILLRQCLLDAKELLTVPAACQGDISASIGNASPTMQMSSASAVDNSFSTPSIPSELDLNAMKSKVEILEQMFRPGSGVMVSDASLVSWIKQLISV
jgi:hypothetical protein